MDAESVREKETPIWVASTDANGTIQLLDQFLDASREVEQSREQALRCLRRLDSFDCSVGYTMCVPRVYMATAGICGMLTLATVPVTLGGSIGVGLGAIWSLLLSYTSAHIIGRQDVRPEAKRALKVYTTSCTTLLQCLDHLKHSYSRVPTEEYILEICKEKPLHILDTVIENPVGLNQHVNRSVKIDGEIVSLDEINILDYLSSKVEELLKRERPELHKLAKLLAVKDSKLKWMRSL